MPTVVITDFMGDDASLEQGLLEEAGVTPVVASSPAPDAWIDHARLAVGILTRHAPLEAATIRQLSRCRVIARYGTGYDNVDLGAAGAQGIVVTNVPGYCTDEVADHALALLLAATRQLPAFMRAVASGEWTPRPLPPVRRLRGRRLALLGCGRIGVAVAERALSFGLQVSAYDPHVSSIPAGVARATSLEELLTDADVLSLHAPLTAGTRGVIGARELALLAPGAIVINVARGVLLDIEAALAALARGQLSTVAVDVLASEPPAADHELRQAQDAILTPHVAYYSTHSVGEAKRRSVGDLLRVLRGAEPLDPVTARS